MGVIRILAVFALGYLTARHGYRHQFPPMTDRTYRRIMASLALCDMSDAELDAELALALSREDYERAADIRDEVLGRKMEAE